MCFQLRILSYSFYFVVIVVYSMDPNGHPSANMITPKGYSQQQPGTTASSSSSNLDLRTDEGELYSPAEVRSIDPVHFDAGDATRLQPSPASAGASRGTRRSSGVVAAVIGGRRKEVSIETDPPSVPGPPLVRAQESERQFTATPLPEEVATPGSPASSATELISRYTSKYDGGVEASLHHVVAVMNPASGETAVSKIVVAGLRDELGTKRVLTLHGDLFADPAPIRLLIKEQAVIYHPPGQPRRQQRGTVVACGGDGTVSFLMTQMDLVQRELEAEFQPFLTCEEQTHVWRYRDGSAGGRSNNLPDLASEAGHPYFTIPALAPLPLGTGNDFSNCVGFGNGFSPSEGCGGCCSGLWALCGCADGGESQVAAALTTAITAPCVTFDRWEVSLVPLQLAQRSLREGSSSGARSSTNVANAVKLVDWAKLYGTRQVSTYSLINYFSVGYDAYVATKFDATRRAHPTVCSTRTQNKAVYVSLGIGGAMRCKKLRKLVPMICVPRPGLATSTTPAAAAAEPQDDDAGGNDAAASGDDFVALQLPSMTKSLVVSNVSCYGAGTHPWNPNGGEPYYHPVTLRNGEIVPSPSSSTAANRELAPLSSAAPTPRPVTINDRIFEVQTMGGLLHYSTLGVGLSGAVKLLQTYEMFVFVLCSPEDLEFPCGQCSAYTQHYLKFKYLARIDTDASVRASLCFQVDGEAMPSITEPTIIHMRRQQGSRILVRCRNETVVQ